MSSFEELRWGGMPYCPHCGSTRVYYIRPIDGTAARRTRAGSISERRVWKCGGCRKQFSVLTGTIFHGSKIPVKTWLFVVFEMCASKNGIAAREIERRYNLTPKSAWFMLHRIREAGHSCPTNRFYLAASAMRNRVSGTTAAADGGTRGWTKWNRWRDATENTASDLSLILWHLLSPLSWPTRPNPFALMSRARSRRRRRGCGVLYGGVL